MNKKLFLGGALGLVAVGAGAFTLTTFAGNSDDAAPRQANTEAEASPNDPRVFEIDGSYFASIGDGKIVKLPDNVNPAGPNAHSATDAVDAVDAPGAPGAPATGETGNTPSDDDGSDQPADGDDSSPADGGAQDTPKTPDYPDMPAPNGDGSEDEDEDSDLIFSPALNDAICKMIHCAGDGPEIIYDTNISEGICQLIECETDSDEDDEKPHILVDRNCAIVGNCEEPAIKDIVIIRRLTDRK